jgi:hypothetical protein
MIPSLAATIAVSHLDNLYHRPVSTFCLKLVLPDRTIMADVAVGIQVVLRHA